MAWNGYVGRLVARLYDDVINTAYPMVTDECRRMFPCHYGAGSPC